MTNGASGRESERTAAAAADVSDLVDASATLMARQAAAMTMLTAYGMSLTAQMTGAFMGAFADALEKRNGDVSRVAAEPSEARPAPAAKERGGSATVVPLRVVKTAPKADDLKRISGIGPKLEKVLRGMGVTTFAQIAMWDDAEMLRIDKELGLENRIIRDDWASQAKALLEG